MESKDENISLEDLRTEIKSLISNTSSLVELFAQKKIPLFLDVDSNTMFFATNIFINVVSYFMYLNTGCSIERIDEFKQSTSKLILELFDIYEEREFEQKGE